jgi:hypothetical protein
VDILECLLVGDDVVGFTGSLESVDVVQKDSEAEQIRR